MKPGTRIHHKWDGTRGTIALVTDEPNAFLREALINWDDGSTGATPVSVLVITKKDC